MQHDSQISAILNAMGVFNMIAPPYASTIIFELHQINQTDHLLKLFYLNDTYSEKPIPLAVPGCAGELSSVSGCHLGKFFHAIEDIIPDNWRRECQLDVEPAFGSGTSSDISGTTPRPVHLDTLDHEESVNPHEEL